MVASPFLYIEEKLRNYNIKNDLGILSIDVDGNDYWLWKAIEELTPSIVICEFNSIFGKKLSLTIPYEEKFIRSQEHYSHLYFGCSIKALVELAQKKGYIFLGTNLNGNNAFFVRSNCINLINSKLQNIKIHHSKFRESRNLYGRLDYKNLDESLDIIEELPIVNLADGSIDKVKNLKKYF